MTRRTHRAKGLALATGVATIVGLVVTKNPGAARVGISGLVVFGVLAMLVGMAWLFLTGSRVD